MPALPAAGEREGREVHLVVKSLHGARLHLWVGWSRECVSHIGSAMPSANCMSSALLTLQHGQDAAVPTATLEAEAAAVLKDGKVGFGSVYK